MSDQPARMPQVLYIDDDPGLARLVQKDLARHGYVVVCAPDGEEGLVRLREGRFDAVALDHFMPGRGGLEILAEIGDLPDAPPVVYVTGSDEGRIAVAALKAGAVDYVIKDVGGEFLALLRAALEQALRREEMRRQRDRAEQDALEARDRAETLLREVNHRVANSLQLISTFVQMQASAIADPHAAGLLRETQNRISAVAQIHRRLYTSDDLRFVEMEEYLRELVDDLRQSLAGEDQILPIELEVQPIRIPTDKAVSIGVIVTELVTNAYKYAYPAGTIGAVRIVMKCVADGPCSLIVEDDGIGWSAGAAPKGSGLGQKIIRAMAASLRSSVEFDLSHKGTRALVSFAP